MKYVKNKDVSHYYGTISSQANKEEYISVGKTELAAIFDGNFTFTIKQTERHIKYKDEQGKVQDIVNQIPQSIGILEINGYELHCLRREYERGWDKIVTKIGKQLNLSNSEINKAISKKANIEFVTTKVYSINKY